MSRPAPSRLVSAVTYAFPAEIRCSVSAPSVCLLGPARLLPNGTARKWTRAVSWRHSRVVLCSGLLRRRPAARSAAPWMGAGWLGDGEPGLGSRREP